MPDNISFVNEMLTHPHDFLRFSPDAVIIVNREHKIIETNEQAQNLFGYSQEEFLSLSINKLLTPDVAKRHNELQNEYFINPRIRGLGERQGVEGVDKQGAILDLDIKLVPYDIDGQRFAMAVVRMKEASRRFEINQVAPISLLEAMRNVYHFLIMRIT